MVLSSNLTLSQGQHSISLQNSGDIKGNINIGLSFSETRDLFECLFSASYPKLLEEAKRESFKSINEFSEKFYEKLNSTIDNSINSTIDKKMEEKFASSEVQILIGEILKQVGSKAENSPNDLLANLLIGKLKSNDNDYTINQAVEFLKYLNRDQILFLCFIKIIRDIPGVGVNDLEAGEISSSIWGIYEEISNRITSVERRDFLIEDARTWYKNYVNNISDFFINNIKNTFDMDLLSINNMVHSDKSYNIKILDVLGRGLGENNYTIDKLNVDFPKFVKFIEIMNIDISEIDYAIQPLTIFGKCIAEHCNIKIDEVEL